jgi:hypothetical protein
MMTALHTFDSPEFLLRRDHFSAEELAGLLGMTLYHVRHAARSGELRAFLVDHHIVAIRREDALNWLEARQHEVH